MDTGQAVLFFVIGCSDICVPSIILSPPYDKWILVAFDVPHRTFSPAPAETVGSHRLINLNHLTELINQDDGNHEKLHVIAWNRTGQAFDQMPSTCLLPKSGKNDRSPLVLSTGWLGTGLSRSIFTRVEQFFPQVIKVTNSQCKLMDFGI